MGAAGSSEVLPDGVASEEDVALRCSDRFLRRFFKWLVFIRGPMRLPVY